MTTTEKEEKNIEPHITKFSGDEYLQILHVVGLFLEKGLSEKPPKFAILAGGVGSGKTTVRRQQFGSGYVHFDFGDILKAFDKTIGKKHSRLTEFAVAASDFILRQAIDEKKNIVIEIIGENEAMISPVITAMRKAGYEISFTNVVSGVVEGYERHKKAVKEDPEYVSAYYTQEATLSFFFSHFELGQMPVSTEDTDIEPNKKQ